MHGLRSFDPHETSFEPAVAEGEPVAIEAEATQDRRVEVLDVEAVLHRGRPQLVGSPEQDLREGAPRRAQAFFSFGKILGLDIFMTSPMFPLILIFPVMNAIWGLTFPIARPT